MGAAASKSNTEAGLSVENMMKFEKESKQSSTETDLGSYEGKYPKDLFNKTVILNNRPIGRVAKETEEVIVVFSDTDSSIRFDIPKSEISVAGASVIQVQNSKGCANAGGQTFKSLSTRNTGGSFRTVRN
jgi:hypothetical protein